MDLFYKLKKHGEDCYIDFNNVPTRINTKGEEVLDFYKCENTEVLFKYRFTEGSMYLSAMEGLKGYLNVEFDNKKFKLSLEAIKRISLRKIVSHREEYKKNLNPSATNSTYKRKMFIQELPKKENGQIDYDNAAGLEVPFYFEGLEDKLTIKDSYIYNNRRYVKLKYKDKESLHTQRSFELCTIEYLTRKDHNKELIGETLSGYEIIDLYSEYKIAEKDGSVRRRDWYKVKCTNCGMYSHKRTDHMMGNKVNKCPDCASRLKQLQNINAKRSYPERVFRSYLEYMDIPFEQEKSFPFSNKKRYDFYFELNNIPYLAEVHGIQHYEESKKMTRFKLTFEEQKKTDKWKKDKAIEEGFNYIEIDAKYSKFDYIIESIINSDLPTDNIDWEYVYANSLVRTKDTDKVKESFNKGLTKKEMVKDTGLSDTYINKTLKELRTLGEIDYDEYEFDYRYHKRMLEKIDECRSLK
ncbi:MAG: hypothetical protein L0I92_08695 [Staphylococcus equorum]|nr:hypothetical protein [Staphylococcus equorum]